MALGRMQGNGEQKELEEAMVREVGDSDLNRFAAGDKTAVDITRGSLPSQR